MVFLSYLRDDGFQHEVSSFYYLDPQSILNRLAWPQTNGIFSFFCLPLSQMSAGNGSCVLAAWETWSSFRAILHWIIRFLHLLQPHRTCDKLYFCNDKPIIIRVNIMILTKLLGFCRQIANYKYKLFHIKKSCQSLSELKIVNPLLLSIYILYKSDIIRPKECTLSLVLFHTFCFRLTSFRFFVYLDCKHNCIVYYINVLLYMTP